MMNRKTKRSSPPLQTTTADVLHYRFTDTGFAEWSKVLQLISPPNKKRRAVALIGQSCENSEENDVEDQEEADSSDEEEEDDSDEEEEDDSDDEQETVARRLQMQDIITKQKLLNRRAIYIPSPMQCSDGPKNAWHKWILYRATYQKLHRNSLPLSEGLHLRRMLFSLQQDESILKHIKQQQQQQPQKQQMSVNCINYTQNDDEDNIPLGKLLGSKKMLPIPAKPPSPPNPKAFYQPPAAFNVVYRQPCYYYNNMQSFPVQTSK